VVKKKEKKGRLLNFPIPRPEQKQNQVNWTDQKPVSKLVTAICKNTVVERDILKPKKGVISELRPVISERTKATGIGGGRGTAHTRVRKRTHVVAIPKLDQKKTHQKLAWTLRRAATNVTHRGKRKGGEL